MPNMGSGHIRGGRREHHGQGFRRALGLGRVVTKHVRLPFAAPHGRGVVPPALPAPETIR